MEGGREERRRRIKERRREEEKREREEGREGEIRRGGGGEGERGRKGEEKKGRREKREKRKKGEEKKGRREKREKRKKGEEKKGGGRSRGRAREGGRGRRSEREIMMYIHNSISRARDLPSVKPFSVALVSVLVALNCCGTRAMLCKALSYILHKSRNDERRRGGGAFVCLTHRIPFVEFFGRHWLVVVHIGIVWHLLVCHPLPLVVHGVQFLSLPLRGGVSLSQTL